MQRVGGSQCMLDAAILARISCPFTHQVASRGPWPSQCQLHSSSSLVLIQPGVSTQWQMELLDLYLEEVGRGRLSCDLLGQFCAAQPKPRPPVFDELAKLAARGGRNAERDLHRWASRQHWFRPLPPLFEFVVPKHVGGDDSSGPQELQHQCMLPHEVFGCLCLASPALVKHLLGTPEEVQNFWAGEEASIREHPRTASWFQKARQWLGASAQDRAKVFPLGIHGDDAGAHGEDNVTVLTWGSVAVDRPTWDTRLCFAMIRKSELVAGQTFERLLGILAWSFRALARGLFPAEDDQGRAFGPDFHPWRAKLANTPLSSAGLRGLWVEMRGDWKFLRESLHLARHYNTEECCHLCRASKAPEAQYSYQDFARTAAVRSTRVADDELLGASAQSPLACGLPCFSIHRVFFDIMHTVDLGVYQVAVPSALAELTRRKPYFFAGRTLAVRVKGASVQYKTWCVEERVQARTRQDQGRGQVPEDQPEAL